ncbi:secondary thiamine-phosphate synthase enzyme YjbQ [soil metagenome]
MNISIHTTKKDEVIDITNRIEEHLNENDNGICIIFIKHTTACITTADLDPGTDLDLLEALRKILPEIKYRHPHNPAHTPDHILSSVISPSITVPFSQGELALGTWQRVVLIELDGPRDRNIELTIIKT